MIYNEDLKICLQVSEESIAKKISTTASVTSAKTERHAWTEWTSTRACVQQHSWARSANWTWTSVPWGRRCVTMAQPARTPMAATPAFASTDGPVPTAVSTSMTALVPRVSTGRLASTALAVFTASAPMGRQVRENKPHSHGNLLPLLLRILKSTLCPAKVQHNGWAGWAGWDSVTHFCGPLGDTHVWVGPSYLFYSAVFLRSTYLCESPVCRELHFSEIHFFHFKEKLFKFKFFSFSIFKIVFIF